MSRMPGFGIGRAAAVTDVVRVLRLSPDFDRAGVAPQHLERKGAVGTGKSDKRRIVLGEGARKAGELQAPGLDLPERLRGESARQLSVGQDQSLIGPGWFGSGMAEDQE